MTPSQTMAKPYSYQHLPDNHFRVLCLININEEPCGTLEVFCFEQPPQYKTLSYVWGSEQPNEVIVCDGCHLPVTRNLYEALKQLSCLQNGSPLKIWTDAVCIDQLNDQEKEIQVKKMHEVYRNAEVVVIWLGTREIRPSASKVPGSESDELQKAMDSDLGMDSNVPTTRLLKSCPELSLSDRLEDYGFPADDSQTWASFANILYRPWFGRLWVIQEAVLAKRLQIFCGSKSVDWKSLSALFEQLSRVRRLPLIAQLDKKKVTSPFAVVTHVDNLRAAREQNGTILIDDNIDEICYISRWAHVSEPVDRVYGLLGMMSPEFRDSVSLDYSENGKKCPWRVYLRFAQAILATPRGIGLLSKASSRQRPTQLPSWCPNFDSLPFEEVDFSRLSSASFSSFDPYKARVKVSKCSNEIEVPGFRIDIVKRIVRSNIEHIGHPADGRAQLWAQETLKWEKECLALSRSTYKNSLDTVPEAHWRTLIADQQAAVSTASLDVARGYHGMKAFLTEFSEEGKISPGAIHEQLMSDYIDQVIFFNGRRFFDTINGRIGLGPMDTKPGDILCHFYHAGPVYVLRYKNDANVGTLIGDAYLHECMKLDDIPNEARGPDETFRLG